MLGWEVIPRIPIGNLSVSPHGVGIAIGYFLGATLMARRARRTGFDEDHAWNAAVVGILGAIIGARVAYVVGHNDQFNQPIEYLQIYKGGISLMGGLIGGFLAAWLYCRAKKLDFLRLADLGAAGLAIGTAVGRIGDLVIGDHLGRTTDGFWGWEYKGGELISSPPCDPAVYPSPDGCIQPGMVVHQTALYDSIWALVIFFVLLRLERKPHPKGFLVLTWAAMYSVGRILTDFTRVDKTWFGTGLTGSQLTAIAVLALSLILLTVRRKAPAVATLSPGKGAAVEPEAPAAGGEAVAVATAAAASSDDAPATAGVGAEPADTEVVAVEAVEAPEETPVVPVEPVDAAAPEAAVPGEPVEPVVPAEDQGGAALDEPAAPPVDEVAVRVEEPAYPAGEGIVPVAVPGVGLEPFETYAGDTVVAPVEPVESMEEAPDVLATVQEEQAPEPEEQPEAAEAGPPDEELAPETVEAVEAADAVVVEAALPLEAPVGEADPADVAALIEAEGALFEPDEPVLESLFPSDIEQLQAEQAETASEATMPVEPEPELPPVTPAVPEVVGPEPEADLGSTEAEAGSTERPEETQEP
jgi:phosphatidylglycerol:prolipoprotein diacylglycerol transferase